jgi:hypothetical protein
MLNQPVSVPLEIGNVISEAMRSFAEEYGLRDYDLWYHDEPLWLVREVSQKPSGEVLVKRVQVSVFDSAEGYKIKAIPDAYVLPSDVKWEEKKTIEADLRVKYSASIIAIDIRQMLPRDTEHAKLKVQRIIEEAWQGASELASNIDTT